MSFRRRMVLLVAGAVAAAIVIASVVVYIVTRDELRGQLDASLRAKITPGRQLVKIEAHLDLLRALNIPVTQGSYPNAATATEPVAVLGPAAARRRNGISTSTCTPTPSTSAPRTARWQPSSRCSPTPPTPKLPAKST